MQDCEFGSPALACIVRCDKMCMLRPDQTKIISGIQAQGKKVYKLQKVSPER